MRTCGDCQLCCKLLPMKPSPAVRPAALTMIEHGLATAESFRGMRDEFHKAAGTRCQHQRHGKGCAIYPTRPFGCRTWNCRWLVNDDTADMRRPDRTHYVIDIMPDYVTWIEHATGKRSRIPVIVIWVDPGFPDAHRDPALRAYLERRAAEGMSALIRFDESVGFTLIAPALADDGQWHEVHPPPCVEPEPEHTPEEKLAALGSLGFVVVR